MTGRGGGLKEDLNSLCETDTLHALWYRHEKEEKKLHKWSRSVSERLEDLVTCSTQRWYVHRLCSGTRQAQMFFLWSMMSSVITGRSRTSTLSSCSRFLSLGRRSIPARRLTLNSLCHRIWVKKPQSRSALPPRVLPSAVETLFKKQRMSFLFGGGWSRPRYFLQEAPIPEHKPTTLSLPAFTMKLVDLRATESNLRLSCKKFTGDSPSVRNWKW